MSTGKSGVKGKGRFYKQNKVRGTAAEKWVVDYLLQRGHQILFANLRTYFAEVDLLTISPEKEMTLWEVKLIHNLSDEKPLVSMEQRKRLLRAFAQISQAANLKTRAHFAAVNQKQEITVFLDFLASENV